MRASQVVDNAKWGGQPGPKRAKGANEKDSEEKGRNRRRAVSSAAAHAAHCHFVVATKGLKRKKEEQGRGHGKQ